MRDNITRRGAASAHLARGNAHDFADQRTRPAVQSRYQRLRPRRQELCLARVTGQLYVAGIADRRFDKPSDALSNRVLTVASPSRRCAGREHHCGSPSGVPARSRPSGRVGHWLFDPLKQVPAFPHQVPHRHMRSIASRFHKPTPAVDAMLTSPTDLGVQLMLLLARHRGFPLANCMGCTPRPIPTNRQWGPALAAFILGPVRAARPSLCQCPYASRDGLW